MTDDDLLVLLSARYAPPAFAFFPAVRNGTGWARRQVRTADAMAMGLWPGRGLDLTGFEIKASRSDWLRELKDPAKADEIMTRCDFWYVVAPSDVVLPGELPSTWGLLVSRGPGLVAAKEAPRVAEPKPLDRLFLAAILRRAVESYVPEAAVRRREEEARKQQNEFCEREAKGSVQGLADLREKVEAFEAASGVRIDDWRHENVGEAVKYVLEKGVTATLADLRRVRESAARALQNLDDGISKIETEVRP